jgi:hypothetical protein
VTFSLICYGVTFSLIYYIRDMLQLTERPSLCYINVAAVREDAATLPRKRAAQMPSVVLPTGGIVFRQHASSVCKEPCAGWWSSAWSSRGAFAERYYAMQKGRIVRTGNTQGQDSSVAALLTV